MLMLGVWEACPRGRCDERVITIRWWPGTNRYSRKHRENISSVWELGERLDIQNNWGYRFFWITRLKILTRVFVATECTSTVPKVTWWRHHMETFSALLAICAGNSPVAGEFPTQRPVTRSFGVFFDLRLSIRVSKQWSGWWFKTPSHPLWRNCNDGLTKSWINTLK